MANKIMSIDELSAKLAMKPASYLKTGVLPIDLVFKGKGLPNDCYGVLWASSNWGKSTMCLSIGKSLSSFGKKTLYAMVEPSMALAEDMGLLEDSNLKFLNVRTYVELESVFDSYLESDYDLLIIDSMTAVSTEKVIQQDEQTGEMQPASDARLSSALEKKMSNMLKNTGKACLCIGQERANFNKGWMGPDTKLGGGYSLKYYAGYVIYGNGESGVLNPETKEVIGTQGYMSCPEKNRFAPPKGRSPVQILFGKGQSNIYALQCYMQWKGLYSQGGANFKVTLNGKEESLRGRVALLGWIRDHYDDLVSMMEQDTEKYFEAGKQGWKPSV